MGFLFVFFKQDHWFPCFQTTGTLNDTPTSCDPLHLATEDAMVHWKHFLIWKPNKQKTVSMVANLSGYISFALWENIPRPSTKPPLSASSRRTSTNTAYFCRTVWVVKQTVTLQLNKLHDTEFNTFYSLHERIQWDKEVIDSGVNGRMNDTAIRCVRNSGKKTTTTKKTLTSDTEKCNERSFNSEIPVGNSGNIHLAHPYTMSQLVKIYK